MMTVLAGIAKFERTLILERQREGIALAKFNGVHKGRQRALKPDEAVALRGMAEAGMPKGELARTYAISRETVYAYLRGVP